MARIDAHEAYAALGIADPTKASITDKLTALGTATDEARKLTDPATLDLLVRDETRKLDEKFSIAEQNLLAPDARERFIESAREQWRARGRAAQAAADAALPLLRQEVEANIAAQQHLRGEGEAPTSNRTEALLARMLDGLDGDRAERWIAERPAADVLRRYREATDDGADRLFARAVETQHALGLLRLTGDAADVLATSQAIRDAIRSRREARVRPQDREALAHLDRLRADLDRAAIIHRVADGPMRVMRSVGKPGTMKVGG